MNTIVAVDLDKTYLKIDSVKLFLTLNIFDFYVLKLVFKRILNLITKKEFHFDISKKIMNKQLKKNHTFYKLLKLFINQDLKKLILNKFDNEKIVILSNSPQCIVDNFINQKDNIYGIGLNPFDEDIKIDRSQVKINSLEKQFNSDEYKYLFIISDNHDDIKIFDKFQSSFYWNKNLQDFRKYLESI